MRVFSIERLREDGSVNPQVKNKEGKKRHFPRWLANNHLSPQESIFLHPECWNKRLISLKKIFLKKKSYLCLFVHLHIPLDVFSEKPQLNEHIPCVKGQMQREVDWLLGDWTVVCGDRLA